MGDATRLSRRGWLIGAIAAACGPARRAGADDKREVEARAKEAGLGPFRSSETELYRGLGNADDAFREQALKLCEGLARDFLGHFKAKGFAVEKPKKRMTVVALANEKDFTRFFEEDPGPATGGLYDIDKNWLVVFDFRNSDAAANARQANTIALMHEATHQLTFNADLLDRQGDIPLCVTEGLAMYGEVRTADGRTKIGARNDAWLPVLAPALQPEGGWIPLERLLVEDKLLNDPDTQHLARAQGWLLVYHLLKTSKLLPGFRAYLAAIRPRRDSDRRLDDARAHLGPLGPLDRDLRRLASTLTRRRS
ncbi:MAG TPA: DUF1570 domain-containing protein [Isosphaeraceae bacterium]|jgi:hypothetical protein|nr:DUF1570 domain-containing protein [Isosphaeraceae bacterium]